ncbi:MAG: hypothetical protein H0U86_00355 [Chloroflexi bacterium]|nr:hypothetical protein [Chloroflexota bacterium]
MRVRRGKFLFLTIVCPLALAVACERPVSEERAGAPSDPPAAAEESSYRILVANPMSHVMFVSLQRADAMAEIGSVPAEGEQIFDIPAPPGATVTLIARDEGKTHSPTVTMMLPEDDTYATWTIE